ncbi:MAG TPA: hypothetical protein VH298_07150, partial [Jatrophihabitans sp.]|nr:hypothetical protein [Jatrophihabitans sp.]
MRLIRTIATGGATLGGVGYLLVRFAPAPAELARQLRAPHHWITQVGTDVAVATVAGALLWLCALWVTIGLAAVWIGQLPGLVGQLGRTVTHCMVPVAIQRLVAASAGFSLLLGGASAEAVGSPTGAPSPTTTATSVMTAPGWPLDQSAPTRPVEVRTPSRPTGTPASSRPVEQPPPSSPVEKTAAGSLSGGWPLNPSSGADATGPTPTPIPTPATPTDPATNPGRAVPTRPAITAQA